ncbi:hypothetical protein M758_UG020600 [Ceratodon purpureus]|nr:hypothetical protein M758_UG020600 [Ceratodon purpureus]
MTSNSTSWLYSKAKHRATCPKVPRPTISFTTYVTYLQQESHICHKQHKNLAPGRKGDGAIQKRKISTF